MKYIQEVKRMHWATDLKQIRVEAVKPGIGDSPCAMCSIDDEDAQVFQVVVVTDKYQYAVVDYQVQPFARERWLARQMALAAAAEISIKFKVPVSDI